MAKSVIDESVILHEVATVLFSPRITKATKMQIINPWGRWEVADPLCYDYLKLNNLLCQQSLMTDICGRSCLTQNSCGSFLGLMSYTVVPFQNFCQYTQPYNL